MVNNCILNGVKSNTVKGLLIQSLPTISKPLLRTQIEEIDGRDGDIVTPLGYSAYNKKMVIGLYGDYEIDDVIKYFDSQGTVIFSNEPDKYYNYQIIDQIDFERLLRFKTASVIFHVQPFKYSAVEGAKSFDTTGLEKITIINSGNTKAKPILTVYGDGLVSLSLNGMQLFNLNITNEYITIDVGEMQAYMDNIFMNRYVSGDYDNLVLDIGSNTLSWTGDVSEIVVEKFSRWI